MIEASLDEVTLRLRRHRAGRKWYRRWLPRSAVAMILRPGDAGLEVLMIERAHRVGDPWSGDMAFPGGRAEPEDADSLHTARRETWEEIGLDTGRYTQHIGRLSELRSRLRRGRRPMVISPHIFAVAEAPPGFTPNYEVADIIWLPLAFLADHDNRQQMQWREGNLVLQLPCYYYGGKRIWGLSLAMLDELVSVVRN